MEKVAKTLFWIDKTFFEVKTVQYFLFGFFGTTLIGTATGFLNYPSGVVNWLLMGLCVYVGLFVFRFVTNKNESAKLKSLYQKNGSLPFLKGFNYSLLLGPLGVVLAIFLVVLSKSNKET